MVTRKSRKGYISLAVINLLCNPNNMKVKNSDFEIQSEAEHSFGPIRSKLNRVIFGANTPAGKLFDVVLMITILISVGVVLAESVTRINMQWGHILRQIEWVITILFTVEYFLRLVSVTKPIKYMTSFYGLVDLFAILPTYLSLIFTGMNALMLIRVLRILRIFRILKLSYFVGEAEMLIIALGQSSRKILVFLYCILTVVIIVGGIMYLVEGPDNGFTSIPVSIYWAIVTMTTVGYGDLVPMTATGRFIATIVIITGYGIIAVPTGIYAAEISHVMRTARDNRGCPGCGKTSHELDADFCKHCGEDLNPLFEE